MTVNFRLASIKSVVAVPSSVSFKYGMRSPCSIDASVLSKVVMRGLEIISPSPFSDDFCAFLIFLKLMNNRNLKVKFSPETAPSPFLIYVSKDKIRKIFVKPKKNEIKKSVQEVSNWLTALCQEKNRSRFLILSSSMGIEKNTLKNWFEELKKLEDLEVQKVWRKYLIDGFIASLDSHQTKKIQKLFPESAIIE